jgi:UDP-glucose 4-epimerase
LKRVLLIGAEGLVGKSFRSLYGQQYDVVAVDRGDQPADYCRGNFDAVFFLAQSADYRSTVMTDNLFAVNVQTVFDCLNRLKDKTQKFVLFSTGSVYQGSDLPLHEQSAIESDSPGPYVASKLAAELVAKGFCKAIRAMWILRPFFIYGREQADSMLFKSMARNIAEGKEIKLSGGEGLWFNPVHAHDVASLMHAIAQDDREGIHVHNVAGPETTSLRRVVELIAKALGKQLVIETGSQPDKKMIASVAVPGWKPGISISEGIHKSFDPS